MNTATPAGRGRLTMASTHIGDPSDIPARSLDALRHADLLIFEEDRPARSFLKAAGVHRDYLRYSEHDQKFTLSECEAALKKGQWVAYMSDQGTPGLADPGRDLVAIAYRLSAKVQVIPGPSSLTAAIAACPFDCWAFHYLGFLPQEPGRRLTALRAAAGMTRPLVIMDTPYRLKHLLGSCQQAFGASRRAFLALDITGPNEDFCSGTVADLVKYSEKLGTKLNFVLIIDGV